MGLLSHQLWNNIKNINKILFRLHQITQDGNISLLNYVQQTEPHLKAAWG